MLDRAEDFLGRVTFVTGPEKHCGKTTFMNRAAELARRGAAAAAATHASAGDCPAGAARSARGLEAIAGSRPAAGPTPAGGPNGPALLTVGYDGEARDFLSGARKPAVPVAEGDIVVTTERFARPCCPEILDVLPGSTALGRLCVARARRAATVALVGPEGNSLVAWAVRRIVGEGLASAVLVDGAINRITQAASLEGARFAYVLRVDASGLDRALARVRRMAALTRLPVATAGAAPGSPDVGLIGANPEEAYAFPGALTAETAARLPRSARVVVVDDFTKIFLADAELAALLRERELYVSRRIEFAGFVVACRGLSDDRFLERLADDSIAALVAFNPYEAGRAA